MFSRSIAYIVPAASQPRFNAILEARGMGPDNVSQPASPTGKPPATHYFGHALETAETETVLTALKAGTVPTDAKDADLKGMTRLQAAAVGRAVTLEAVRYAGDRPRARVDALLARSGLKAIEAVA